MKEYKPGDYYEFDSNEKTIVSKKEENGYEDQYFYTEEIKWKVLYRDEEAGEMLLISEKPIEQKITLQGQTGYENGIELLDRLCRDIAGRKETRSLTKEDIEKSRYWEDKSGTKAKLIFGEDNNFYNWLATQSEGYWGDGKNFRLFLVSGDTVNAYYLYDSNNDTNSISYAVRPVIEVDIEN